MTSKCSFLLVIILTINFFDGLSCNPFASTSYLRVLPMYEMTIVSKIWKVLYEKNGESDEFENYEEHLKDLKKSMKASYKQISEVNFHPVDSYHRFKRLAEYRSILESLNEPPTDEHPGQNALHEQMDMLARLQNTYLLPINDLVNGTIRTRHPETGIERTFQALPLNANDCLKIAEVAFSYASHNETVLWAEQAVRLEEEERIDVAELIRNRNSSNWNGDQQQLRRDFRGRALSLLAVSLEELSYYTEALDMLNKASELLPQTAELEQLKSDYEYEAQANPELIRSEDFGHTSSRLPLSDGFDLTTMETYKSLCRGERYLTDSTLSALHCFYLDPSNIHDPYYKLWRVKVEEAFKYPHIVQFIDVITDDEIADIKAQSQSQLEAHYLVDSETLIQERAYRICSTAWGDPENPLFDVLSRRVGAFTGMETGLTSSEELQIANYGLGGHYAPHTDSSDTNEPDDGTDQMFTTHGNRIATWMFYLSDVTAGGATVFPSIGVTIWPRKGSAAFWYNLRSSGSLDTSTLHAGCPVLVGSKWVSNKWIRERGQTFRKPCHTKPDEYLLVDGGRHH